MTVTRAGLIAAVSLAAFSIAAAVLSGYLAATMPPGVPAAITPDAGNRMFLISLLATLAAAVFLLWRAPTNGVSWLFGGIVALLSLSAIGEFYGPHVANGPGPTGAMAAFLAFGTFMWFAFLGLFAIWLPALFPTGRALTPRWRWLTWLSGAAILFVGFVSALDPTTLDTPYRHVANPVAGALGIHLSEQFVSVVRNLSGFVFMACVVAAIVSMVLRYRRATTEERHQLKWFVGSIAVVLVALSSSFVVSSVLLGVLAALAFAFVPISIAIAVVRYRLYDVDVVINKALVYGLLAALITLVYAAVVVGAGSLIGATRGNSLVLSLVATALVAVGFQPARQRLQAAANRLVYGRRYTPYEVLADLGMQARQESRPDELLRRVVDILADGTGAEWAQLWLRADGRLRLAAAHPRSEPREMGFDGALTMPDADRVAPVMNNNEVLGALALKKQRGESLNERDEKLLDDLASQLGVVLRNFGLTSELVQRLEELRQSRERLVKAQDEERRRLERNLHDGAQQHLVALKVKVGLIKSLLERNPDQAKALVEQLGVDADEALDELRELARGIYPPVLADQGLAAALEAHARRATVPVSVEADAIPRLPEQVEAAVYFCCLEALQNVQKYANASAATVRLALDPGSRLLRFEVADDGSGFDVEKAKRGAGVLNMTDRVEALGGRLDIESAPGRGTTVRGAVPVEHRAAEHSAEPARAAASA